MGRIRIINPTAMAILFWSKKDKQLAFCFWHPRPTDMNVIILKPENAKDLKNQLEHYIKALDGDKNE